MSDPHAPTPEPQPNPPSEAAPADGGSVAATPPTDDLQKRCDAEFERYYKERDGWTKEQLDAEKSYDQLLVAISTLALGSSLTKDWVSRGGFWSPIFLVVAWIAFAACLALSLLHRYFTYYTHRELVKIVDEEFRDWKRPGAMQRALEHYDEIPFIKRVERLKVWAGCSVGLGILFSLFFLFANVAPPPPPQQAPAAATAVAAPATFVTPLYPPTINVNTISPLPVQFPVTQPVAPSTRPNP
jgi:hypothetical protein